MRKWSPEVSQRMPKGSQKGTKVIQKGAKGRQKGAKGHPKGSQSDQGDVRKGTLRETSIWDAQGGCRGKKFWSHLGFIFVKIPEKTPSKKH